MRKWMLFLLVIGFSNHLSAQENNSSLLWEITGNGLKKPSYLFGTFHLICANDFSFTPLLKEKLLATKQLYLEIDLSKPGIQLELMSMMRLNGTSLDKEMGDDFSAISAKFQQITGTSLLAFKQFNPFLGISMLTLKTVPCAETIQPESIFMKIAKEDSLAVMGLESIADQANAINHQPLADQIHDFKKMVNNFDSVKLQMQALIQVYKLNNTDSVYQYMHQQNMTDAFEQTMLIKRNKNWIPKIIDAISLKPAFFAVGAGHLGGKEGVIELLRQKGYRLQPLIY